MQTGLISNRALIVGLVETNKLHEIIMDGHCQRGVKGGYAAGGIITLFQKQVIIAISEGVDAGLSVFVEEAHGNPTALPKREKKQGGQKHGNEKRDYRSGCSHARKP